LNILELAVLECYISRKKEDLYVLL
jgi:hypothetical protein